MNSIANFVMSKAVGDVISDNFCLEKFLQKNIQKGEEGEKMKIIALGLNSTKFCIHNM